jgi:hypothetical protein
MGGEYPKGGGGDIPGAFAPLGGGHIPRIFVPRGQYSYEYRPRLSGANLLGGGTKVL